MKRLLVLCALTLQMASAADPPTEEMVPRVQTAAVGPPPGGTTLIMGGVRHPAIAAWCRMFAPADITPTATGPVSRRRSALANPAPLDIDELGAHAHDATDGQCEPSLARIAPPKRGSG